MMMKKRPKDEGVEDEGVWVCADCLNDLPVPKPAACPRCGSTAANPK